MSEIDIPDFIGKARVVCYAVVNLSLPTGNTQHFVNGKLRDTAYGLAICEYKPGDGYYLFSCSSNWVEFADTWHETIEDAKDQAEFEYAGISNNWVYKLPLIPVTNSPC
jgi:hypothetical protein